MPDDITKQADQLIDEMEHKAAPPKEQSVDRQVSDLFPRITEAYGSGHADEARKLIVEGRSLIDQHRAELDPTWVTETEKYFHDFLEILNAPKTPAIDHLTEAKEGLRLIMDEFHANLNTPKAPIEHAELTPDQRVDQLRTTIQKLNSELEKTLQEIDEEEKEVAVAQIKKEAGII